MGNDPADEVDVPADGDFLRWATGSGRRAAAIILLPVVAGLIVGIVTTFIGFGLRYPTFMYMIPWDLTANYECFVLPRNMVRGCLVLAPIAAAVAFWVQPRLRLAAEGEVQRASLNGPAINPYYLPIAGFGALLMVVAPAVFDLYGTGWYFACRMQDLYGTGGRIALSAMIALVAPAACLAAVVFAYQLRRYLALAAVPKAAAKALRPIGLVLVAAGLISIVYAGWVVRKSDPGTAMLTGVLYLALGTLILKGSLGAARLMGWLAAGEIAVAFGLALTAPLRSPLGLLQAKLHVDTLATVFPIVAFFASFALLLWIYLAVRDKTILAARRAAGRSTALPWTGFAFGALMVVSEVFQIFYWRPADLTAEAERRARTKYGAGYSYYVSSVSVSTGGIETRAYAQVTGYSRDKVFDADVDWKR
ncbi:hypothetical protein [Dongia sp.]|uniref:hypothetical protein n=1 Tax=Dongia sp. TaxID=1977262 RepID=UPI003753D998